MSINRYNYEEFFLLYADGELHPLEVEMVNQFVQLHPDLKEELDILMDCKLVADVPVFFPKEKLYKQTVWDAENITDTQSQLLLLLDNELIGKDKETLEKDIEENPVLQHEWNTLQQAKLPAEAIAHPYKKPLYRERKIPKLGWLRWAAAAAIIGAGWFLVDKNIAGNKVVAIPVIAKNISVKKQQNPTITTQPSSTETATDDQENDNETNVAQENSTPQNQGEDVNSSVKKENQTAQNNQPSTIQKESPLYNPNNTTIQDLADNTNQVADQVDDRKPLITSKVIDDVQEIQVKPAVVKLKAPKPGQLASTINYKPSQNLVDLQADADDNEYVRIAGARVKKQKIRSVFRGVFRGLGRTFSNSKVEPASVALNNE